MKNKKKKQAFFLILFLGIGFFGIGANVFADFPSIIINKIQISGGTGKTTQEFIELYNFSESAVDLKLLPLKLHIVSSTGFDSGKNLTFINTAIPTKGYFLIASEDYAKNAEDTTIAPDATYSTSGNSLVPDGALYINTSTTKNSAIIDLVGFGKNLIFETAPIKNLTGDQVAERINFQDTNGNALDFAILDHPIPRNSQYKGSEIIPDPVSTPLLVPDQSPEPPPPLPPFPARPPAEELRYQGNFSDVKLNEILPAPEKGGKEFVEFYNIGNAPINLEGWRLKDKSLEDKSLKYGKDYSCVVTKMEILPDKYATFYLENCDKNKISLNNGGDSLSLYNPVNNNVISAASYGGAKTNLSYSFDGSKWRWSKYLTPEEENIFDDAPDFEIKKDKEIFKNFPANFDVKIKNYKKDKTKITWDFGDGHKSYKQKATHKYERKGRHSGSVKIFNGSEEVIKNFEIKVKNFPRYDVKIVSLVPNPKGSDTDFESITLKNNSKKKINLQNWSIATGDKKLANHPIALKTILKPKEILKITRDISKFTLNNKKAKVELRYPSGKVAFKMQYDKKTETAKEGEVLEKTRLGWAWKNTLPSEVPAVSRETSLLAAAPKTEENLESPVVLGESDVKNITEEFFQADDPPEAVSEKDFKTFSNDPNFPLFFWQPICGINQSCVEAGETSQPWIKPVFDLASLLF